MSNFVSVDGLLIFAECAFWRGLLVFESGELSGRETFLATGFELPANRRTVFVNTAAKLTIITAQCCACVAGGSGHDARAFACLP